VVATACSKLIQKGRGHLHIDDRAALRDGTRDARAAERRSLSSLRPGLLRPGRAWRGRAVAPSRGPKASSGPTQAPARVRNGSEGLLSGFGKSQPAKAGVVGRASSVHAHRGSAARRSVLTASRRRRERRSIGNHSAVARAWRPSLRVRRVDGVENICGGYTFSRLLAAEGLAVFSVPNLGMRVLQIDPSRPALFLEERFQFLHEITPGQSVPRHPIH